MTIQEIAEQVLDSHPNWMDFADMPKLQKMDQELQSMTEDSEEAQALIASATEDIKEATRQAEQDEAERE
jgi:hypothetical protein